MCITNAIIHKVFVKISDDETEELIKEAESKKQEDLTQEEKMALLGRPRLGDTIKTQLRVKESKEFKVHNCLA